jgi:hypothetical protein
MVRLNLNSQVWSSTFWLIMLSLHNLVFKVVDKLKKIWHITVALQT